MSEVDISLKNEDLRPDIFYRSLSHVENYTSQESALFLKRPEENVQDVHNRFKNLAQRGYIHRRFAPDATKTSPAYYGIDDLAVAETLFSVIDTGIRESAIMEAVSLACYAWNETSNPRPGFIPENVSPILAAMVGADRGESWALRLAFFVDEQTNQRQLLAAVHFADAPQGDLSRFLPPGFLPRADITINLTLALLRFAPTLRAARERSRH